LLSRRFSLRIPTRDVGLKVVITRVIREPGCRTAMVVAVANLAVAGEERFLGREELRTSVVGPHLLPPTGSFGQLVARQ
jgi:hypothetical protein